MFLYAQTFFLPHLLGDPFLIELYLFVNVKNKGQTLAWNSSVYDVAISYFQSYIKGRIHLILRV